MQLFYFKQKKCMGIMTVVIAYNLPLWLWSHLTTSLDLGKSNNADTNNVNGHRLDVVFCLTLWALNWKSRAFSKMIMSSFYYLPNIPLDPKNLESSKSKIILKDWQTMCKWLLPLFSPNTSITPCPFHEFTYVTVLVLSITIF